MNRQPDQLSKLLLEADGLLLLLHRHRDETPIDAIKLLRKKLELILALTEGLDEETEASHSQIDEDNLPEPLPETKESLFDQSVESNVYESVCLPEPLSESIPETSYESESSNQPNPANESEQNLESEPVVISDHIENTIEYSESTDVVPEFFKEPEHPIFTDCESTESTVFINDDTRSIDPPVEQPVYHRTYVINETTKTNEPHTPRRPVSSVFNLNDKFRFRRELFGNSDAQYVECLDMLSAMKSLDEAKEYLFEDLNWNPENEDAKAFIELLSNYYQ